MKWKIGTPVMVFLAGALFSRTIRFDSPREPSLRTPEVITQPAPASVDGVQVFEVAQRGVRAGGRNLFAFDEVVAPVRHRVVQRAQPQFVQQTPQVAQSTEVVVTKEPEFPMRFIGTFGMTKDPIAVFEGNGEVVNAKVGDRVTGEFKLASIGIESVEVATARGSTQRVALRGGQPR